MWENRATACAHIEYVLGTPGAKLETTGLDVQHSLATARRGATQHSDLCVLLKFAWSCSGDTEEPVK